MTTKHQFSLFLCKHVREFEGSPMKWNLSNTAQGSRSHIRDIINHISESAEVTKKYEYSI